eukprot:2228603-Rhodomonas_salina.1
MVFPTPRRLSADLRSCGTKTRTELKARTMSSGIVTWTWDTPTAGLNAIPHSLRIGCTIVFFFPFDFAA